MEGRLSPRPHIGGAGGAALARGGPRALVCGMLDKTSAAPPAAGTAPNVLVSGPILPTLIRLSLPNMIAMSAAAFVGIAETSYVGRLGTPALAGLTLVFPMVMLLAMLSAGAMGGGVSSAVSRALGAGQEARASALAMHAFVIGALAGLASAALLLAYGPAIYGVLGGRGEALERALGYSNMVAFGALGIWLTNTLASVARGSGDMKIPSLTLLLAAGAQIILGGGFGLGIGPFPDLGMAGVALGLVLSTSAAAAFLLWYLACGRARVRLDFSNIALRREMFADILKVGALASVGPVQTVLTVFILTRLAAQFGTEALAGYGLGARLEFLLIPVAFGIGVACVPMVGMAIGARDISRARRVAWTGGLLAAAVLGVVGCTVALFPGLWTRLFTGEPGVLEAGALYFAFAGPCYALFGLGLCLYFASQGAGKVLGPVLAGTSRLIIVLIGGYWFEQARAPVWALFALLAFAMAVYGLATAFAVYVSRWGPAVSAQAPRR